MKKTDIAMIILIASVGVLIAFFVASNLPFLKLPEEGIKVQTMDKITADLVDPNPEVFNSEAINPTVEIIVGNENTE